MSQYCSYLIMQNIVFSSNCCSPYTLLDLENIGFFHYLTKSLSIILLWFKWKVIKESLLINLLLPRKFHLLLLLLHQVIYLLLCFILNVLSLLLAFVSRLLFFASLLCNYWVPLWPIKPSLFFKFLIRQKWNRLPSKF